MTGIVVRLPSALRGFAGGTPELDATPGTLRDVLEQLRLRHPQLVARLLTADGELRPYVNIFVGHANIRRLQGLDSPVPAGATLSILPAVAGG
jgi:molybdopterin converting factor small subunit